jgi:hypothetical protein
MYVLSCGSKAFRVGHVGFGSVSSFCKVRWEN